MSAWPQVLSTALGAGVGGGAVVYGQYLASKRAADAEDRAWQRRRQDQRDDAQRATILELQTELVALREVAAGVMAARTVVGQEEPEQQQRGDALALLGAANAFSERSEHTRMLISRTTDPELRRIASELVEHLMDLGRTTWDEAGTRAQETRRRLALVDDRVTVLLAVL